MITDWGQALWASLAGAMALLFAAVPRILGFVIILLVGWFIASLIATAVAALLRAVRFNDLARRAGVSDFIQQMGISTDPAGFLAAVVSWFVRLIALVVAFDALGLPAVSQVLQQFLLWVPNLVVAVVMLVLAGLAAAALGNLVRGATARAGFSNPDFLSAVTRIAVWGFGIVIAVNQIGIAQTLVNTLFFGLVGALALALGLAFGLGGRETAGQIVQGWYRQSQDAAAKMERAGDAAAREVGAAQRSAADDARATARMIGRERGAS